MWLIHFKGRFFGDRARNIASSGPLAIDSFGFARGFFPAAAAHQSIMS
jgi:hypothetical protein